MLLDKLIDIVGPDACVTDENELEPNLTEWRDIYHGKTLAMISPTSCVPALLQASVSCRKAATRAFAAALSRMRPVNRYCFRCPG